MPDQPEQKVRIATRRSPLALVQARWVQQALSRADPHTSFELLPMETEGDRQLQGALQGHGGKGLFIQALDEALLSGQADVAVHSAKDVPHTAADGIAWPVITQRVDPRDVWVAGTERHTSYKHWVETTPPGWRVGTASVRRTAQVLSVRPDWDVVLVRGNLGTRLRRLEEGVCDGLLLAAAGLERMGWRHRCAFALEPDVWVPAAGQGALILACRSCDMGMQNRLQVLHDPLSSWAVRAERAVCRALGADCGFPLGVHAHLSLHLNTWCLQAFVGCPAGSEAWRGQWNVLSGITPEEAGEQFALYMRSQAQSLWKRLGRLGPYE